MKSIKDPTVGIIMGSKSDWKDVMEHCSEMLKEFGIKHDVRVISAHRTPKTFSGCHSCLNNYTGARCTDAQCNRWHRQPLINCTNASWCSCCYFGDWKGWSQKFSVICNIYFKS